MDYCEMVAEEGLSAINSYHTDTRLDDLPDERTAPGFALAPVLENKCLTPSELAEAYDYKEWNK